MSVLVTGGAGFIGSCVVHALADAGLTPVVLDDLSAGAPHVVGPHPLVVGDIADAAAVDRAFREHDVDTVIHCAAVKSVPESVAQPLRYYRENVAKTITLLEHLQRHGCTRLIFSSSAAVYADGHGGGIGEDDGLATGSPYARTKLVIEEVLRDVAAATTLRPLSLRYFNPIGADPQQRSGPSSGFMETALGGLLTAWSAGGRFRLMGTDWPTSDGTAVRDYVHVRDVAEAHVAAVHRLRAGPAGSLVCNVGSGCSTSLRQLVSAFESVVGTRVRLDEAPRRPGDIAGGHARVDRARTLLDWSPRFTLEDAVRDSIAWTRRSHGDEIRLPRADQPVAVGGHVDTSC